MKTPDDIKRIAVLGAGLMGHGIALELAAHHRFVHIYDVSEQLLDKALNRCRVGLKALNQADLISFEEIETSISRISTSLDLSETVEDTDLVIEAVSENLDLKRTLFRKVDKIAPDNTVLVSNTSTFLPSALAVATQRPRQIAGVHYYNPPHLLPGVEIIKGPETSDDTIELLTDFYSSIGKRPALIHKEIQGFIGNRLQVALLREAMSIVRGGHATAPEIDQVVRSRMGKLLSVAGPFELADIQGLDSVLAVAESEFPLLAKDRSLPGVLMDKIHVGDLGVKTGRGFYEWTAESIEAWRKNMADSLIDMATRDR
ncbi:MAG: 3-hydroxyacyl-CoA dehydrogenase family protein [Chloroflexota bacterium]|nr:3-hydroxyacyl-CoA dehydrogenase family protein [Chloroflexota bacterium]